MLHRDERRIVMTQAVLVPGVAGVTAPARSPPSPPGHAGLQYRRRVRRNRLRSGLNMLENPADVALMPKHIFITGATGFLGRSLLQRFLKDTNNILYLLARSQTAEEYLIDELAWADVARIKIVRGDITRPRLGLETRAVRSLATAIDEVWHTAAATQFADTYKPLLAATNVQGTKHVLDLGTFFKRMTDFYYLSTAYVCGSRRGRVPEGAFAAPASFNNAYEESKYDAECLVRSSGLPFTIIRPSILIGDSRTGDATGERSRVIYGYILAVYHAILRLFPNEIEFWKQWENRSESRRCAIDLRLCGASSVTKNLITVDDAVNVCLAIRESRDRGGKTFNVVNERSLTLASMLESLQTLLKVHGITFEPGLSLSDIKIARNPAETFAYKMTRQFRPYARVPEPSWMTDNVERLGVARIPMTPQLFTFLVRAYMRSHLLVN